jgi:hypothetical protein
MAWSSKFQAWKPGQPRLDHVPFTSYDLNCNEVPENKLRSLDVRSYFCVEGNCLKTLLDAFP